MVDIQVVILDEEPIAIIKTEAQGPPGASPRLPAIAGEDIATYSVLRSHVDGRVRCADFEVDEGDILGVSVSAAPEGDEVFYVTCGLKIPLAGASPGERYYLGSAGGLTSTPPANGLLRLIGICHEPGSIVLQESPTIRRRVWV